MENKEMYKVVYIYGELVGQGLVTKSSNFEELLISCENIYSAWRENNPTQDLSTYVKEKLTNSNPLLKLTDIQLHEHLLKNNVKYSNSEMKYIVDFATDEGFTWNEKDKVWEK